MKVPNLPRPTRADRADFIRPDPRDSDQAA
jgi:hypothetical protein